MRGYVTELNGRPLTEYLTTFLDDALWLALETDTLPELYTAT
jgi:hypothetical protein